MKGDIVYSRRGDVERRALIRDPEAGWLCGTGSLRVRFGSHGVSPTYASYYLGHPAVRAWIVRHAVGATMANLNTGILSALPFVIPPLHEQRAIASILGALDDKIDLNRRMNATLDETARLYFDAWFLRFDHTGGIRPADWKTRTVHEVAEINGWTLSGRDPLPAIDYIEISEVMKGDIAKVKTYVRGAEPSRARRRLRHGDTALSTVRPDRGSYFLALNPSDHLIASTGFAVVTPKTVPWSVLYLGLTRVALLTHFGRLADGGAYPAIPPQLIGQVELALPTSDALLREFHSIASPLLERVETNRRENQTLATLRDTLLPKLISGELRVKDAEQVAGALL